MPAKRRGDRRCYSRTATVCVPNLASSDMPLKHQYESTQARRINENGRFRPGVQAEQFSVHGRRGDRGDSRADSDDLPAGARSEARLKYVSSPRPVASCRLNRDNGRCAPSPLSAIGFENVWRQSAVRVYRYRGRYGLSSKLLGWLFCCGPSYTERDPNPRNEGRPSGEPAFIGPFERDRGESATPSQGRPRHTIAEAVVDRG